MNDSVMVECNEHMNDYGVMNTCQCSVMTHMETRTQEVDVYILTIFVVIW